MYIFEQTSWSTNVYDLCKGVSLCSNTPLHLRSFFRMMGLRYGGGRGFSRLTWPRVRGTVESGLDAEAIAYSKIWNIKRKRDV